MGFYKYQAVSKDGAKVNGVVEAYNEIDAVDQIRETCEMVVKLTPIREDNSKIANLLGTEIGGKKLDVKQMSMICSQFAILIRSGVSIVRSVELVAKQTKDKKLKKLFEEVKDDVEAGRTMYSSLEEHGAKFLPVVFIETIRAGEESGNLDLAFESMSEYFVNQMSTSGKVKAALAYPIFVIIVAIGVVIVLMAKVVPTFTKTFAQYGADLPLMTRMLIAISTFFQKWWIFIIIAIVLAIIIYKIVDSTESGKIFLSKIALKMPLMGNIQRMNAACQFSNNLSILIASGIPINYAISITSKIIENRFISSEVSKISDKVVEGHSLGEALSEVRDLPEMLVDMTNVGEETGQLEETLDKVGKYYNMELDNAIKSALAKLEPALLVIIALIAGFIVIAMYLAMFEMYGVM